MLKNLFLVAILTWSCFFGGSRPQWIQELPEIEPTRADTLLVMQPSMPSPQVLLPHVDPGPPLLVLPASHDIRLEISYAREDTLGFDIEPVLRMQARYVLQEMNSDWYDLRCESLDRSDCDYYIADNETASAQRDTLMILISRILWSDPQLLATWWFRFRLEYQGKFSTWNVIGPIKFVATSRLGVPRRPTIKIL